jgi:hypothetical protein
LYPLTSILSPLWEGEETLQTSVFYIIELKLVIAKSNSFEEFPPYLSPPCGRERRIYIQ